MASRDPLGRARTAPPSCSPGTYNLEGEVAGRPCLAAIVLREAEWDCPLIPLMADEIVKDEPGLEACSTLLDLL